MKKQLSCLLLSAAMIFSSLSLPVPVFGATIQGDNLALEKAGYAPEGTYHNGGQWNLNALTDGKTIVGNDYATNSGFHSNGSGNPQIVGVNLGSKMDFNRFVFYARTDSQGAGQSYPVDFTIEVSDDGVTFTPVKEVHDYVLADIYAPQTFDIGQQSAQYVQLSVSKSSNNDTTTALAEIEIYHEREQVSAPTANVESGFYSDPIQVTLSSETQDATIYYTTDGSTPDTSSASYSEPIDVSVNTTIKAIATKDGLVESALSSYSYEIGQNPDEGLTYEIFKDDFSNASTSNTLWSANPTIVNGEFALERGVHAGLKNLTLDNAIYEADISTVGTSDWIGLLFNRNNITDTWDDSGYMLYMRRSGEVDLLRARGVSVASGTPASSYTPGSTVHLKLIYRDGNIKVYLNGEKKIDVEDSTYTSGYAGFFVSGGSGSGKLDNVSVKIAPVNYDDKVDEYVEFLAGTQILRDDTLLRLPSVPEGHNVTIESSSDESVVKLDRTVIPPSEEKTVTITYKVTCLSPERSVTFEKTYTVPRKTTPADTAFAQAAEYGLFVHYVWGDSNFAAIDENGNHASTIQEFLNDFDVNEFAENCQSFGVQYVIFTAWHYKMTPIYYSPVFREWRENPDVNNPSSSDRDLIMEISNALSAKGIDLYLYTHPNDIHDLSDADKAKFDYKSVGDTTFNKELWNDYLSAQYKELSERYKGKIKGYFMDEGLGSPSNSAFVDYARIRAVIKDVDPSLIMIQNWSEVPGAGSYLCDTGMVEDRIQTSWSNGDWGSSLGTSITDGDSWPSFGLPFAARLGERPMNWTAMYNKDGEFTGQDTPEFQNKPLTLADARDLFRYVIYQAASNSEGMGTSWAAGPYRGTATTENGIWEPGVKQTLTDVGTKITPIKESVFGTKPSTSWPAQIDVNKNNPRTKTNSIGNTTYVAMTSIESNREFIHVLNPQLTNGIVSGNTLTLPKPKDNRTFVGAKLLHEETLLDFSIEASGEIKITLPEGKTWDSDDTVIELLSTIDGQTDVVTVNPESGTYSEPISVALSCATEGASIYYTLDGSEPTQLSAKYVMPIVIAEDTTIKAFALKEGLTSSPVTNLSYIIIPSEDDLNYTVFADDFSDQAISNTLWQVTGGTGKPTLSNDVYALDLGIRANMKDITFNNAVYEADMAVQGNADWIGLLFNRDNMTDIWDNSGYMLYMRLDGRVELIKAQGGVIASGSAATGYNQGDYVHVKIFYYNGSIMVYLNGEKKIDVHDTTYTGGYAGFFVSGTAGSGKLDNVQVRTTPPLPDSDEVIENTFSQIKSKLDGLQAYIDQTELVLPKMPSNRYRLRISGSSDEELISSTGRITLPVTTKSAGLTFEINYDYAGKTKMTTYETEVSVPKPTTPEDIAFFKDSKYGLFVHYVWAGERRIGLGGQPEEISARTPDGTKMQTIDEMIERFDAEQFAQDCEDMGMQYVVFTIWHYGMNPVYPSEVYKEWRTHEPGDLPADDGQHDLIDKVYQELSKKGIDLYLYTHPYDIHDLYPEDKAKFDYKSAGDLTFDYDKWNDYLNAQYEELCERYKGKIKGMFLDEGLANPANNLSVDYPRLRNTVKSVDPSLLMMQNEYNGKYSCDTSMWELPTAWHGGEFNNLATWQVNNIPIGTSIGNIYKGYSWWAIKDRGEGTNGLETAENAYLYTVMQAGANTEGGGMAWAAGPYAGNDGGIWEDGVKERLVTLYSYMEPIEEAIKNTRPSTSFVTPPKSKITDLDWGVATQSADGSKTYLHILKPPAGKEIQIGIPLDGKVFSEGKMLVSGKSVVITQDDSGISITIPVDENWDSLNTVIELTADFREVLSSKVVLMEQLLKNSTPWLYNELDLSKLEQAILVAKELMEDLSASETQLQSEINNLELAGEIFRKSVITNSVAGDNYALGVQATASSSISSHPNFKLEFLTDGKKFDETAVGWTSDPHTTTPNNTEWVQLDLGETKRIGRVDLTPSRSAGYAFPIDFYIEVSLDGINYEKVYTQTGYVSDGTAYQVHFAACDGRYVRVTGTKQSPDQANGQSYRMQFGEIEIFGMSVEEAAYRVDAVQAPALSDTAITMPIAPEGFTVKYIISSSNTNVVALDGTITHGNVDTVVELVFEVVRDNDNATAYTHKIEVTIPANGEVLVQSITMATQPHKREYVVGQELDITGGRVKVVFDNASEEFIDLVSDMVSGYDKNTLGMQTLTVTYKGKTTTYTVTVIDKVVTPTPIVTPTVTPLPTNSPSITPTESPTEVLSVTPKATVTPSKKAESAKTGEDSSNIWLQSILLIAAAGILTIYVVSRRKGKEKSRRNI